MGETKNKLFEEIKTYFCELSEAGETPDIDKHFDFQSSFHREKTTTSSNAYLHFDSNFNPKIGMQISEAQQFIDATHNDDQVFLKTNFTSEKIELLQTFANIGSDSRLGFVFKRQPVLLGNPEHLFRKAEIFLLNGPPQLGLFGGDLFTGENYTIRITRNEKVRDAIVGHQKKTSGFLITHKVVFSSSGSKGLVPAKILDYIFLYLQFLSFVRGANTSTGLITFLNDDGTTEGLYLGSGKITSLPNPKSWHDIGIGPMQPLFDGFLRMKKDEKWRRGLDEALSWYKAANKPGNDLEASIILAQSALESLAYAHLIYDLKLRERLIIDLKASDKIEILLASLGIKDNPLEHASNFISTCDKNKFPIRPCERMTSFRNRLVHAKSVDYDGLSALEALRAYLWIIETVILVRVGYKGEYQDQRILGGWRGGNRASTQNLK